MIIYLKYKRNIVLWQRRSIDFDKRLFFFRQQHYDFTNLSKALWPRLIFRIKERMIFYFLLIPSKIFLLAFFLYPSNCLLKFYYFFFCFGSLSISRLH